MECYYTVKANPRREVTCNSNGRKSLAINKYTLQDIPPRVVENNRAEILWDFKGNNGDRCGYPG